MKTLHEKLTEFELLNLEELRAMRQELAQHVKDVEATILLLNVVISHREIEIMTASGKEE